MSHPYRPVGIPTTTSPVPAGRYPKTKVYADGRPGAYFCRCACCEELFLGDKRDCVCQDCEIPDSYPTDPILLTAMLGQLPKHPLPPGVTRVLPSRLP